MLTYSSLTVKDVLSRSQIQYSDRPSLAFVGSKPLSYCELSIIVNNISSLLVTLGVEKGDRVMLVGENSPNWCIAYLSITCMGAVVVPTSCEITDVEFNSIFNHCQPKVVFLSAKQSVKRSINDDYKLADFILLNNFEPINPCEDKIDKSTSYTLPEAKFNVDFCGLDMPEPREEDLAVIVYKAENLSEQPLGVMLTHKNIITNCLSTLTIHNVKSCDRLLSIIPLWNSFESNIGFVLPIMQGASVWYLSKRPSLEALHLAFQSIKPTIILAVPHLVEKIYTNIICPSILSSRLKAKYYRFPLFRKLINRLASKEFCAFFGDNVKFMGIGGGSISTDVEHFLFDTKFPYSTGYGITEASTLLSGCKPTQVRKGCVGVALPGQEIKIQDPNQLSGEGEIWVRGANIMLGYFKNQKLTNQVISSDGWLRTGDTGLIHPDGYIELRGKACQQEPKGNSSSLTETCVLSKSKCVNVIQVN